VSGLDDLLEELQRRIEHRVLGRRPHMLHLATIRLHVVIPTPKGGMVRARIDAAGIDPDDSLAHIRCMSELAERLVGTAPTVLAERSVNHLRPGAGTLSWQDLTPYDPDILANMAPGLDGRVMRWCRGTGMRSGSTYAVPASKVMPGWALLAGDQADDGECDSSGLAAGVMGDIDRCRQHALYEVLERDALMLAWRLPTWARAEVHQEYAGDTVAGFARDRGLDLSLYEIGDPCIAPVVLCLVTDRAGRLACGSACTGGVSEAAERASLEAVLMWNGRRARPPNAPVSERVRTSNDHVAWAWWHAGVVTSWFQALPGRAASETVVGLDAVAERCRQRFFGAEPVVVDLAGVDDVAITSATRYVCRVLQPHAMRKEWCAERPFVGGTRFRALADGSEVNLLPHPFG
jgi:ribosomal protein S12 methylthiotransferase accessory factor YcaO